MSRKKSSSEKLSPATKRKKVKEPSKTSSSSGLNWLHEGAFVSLLSVAQLKSRRISKSRVIFLGRDADYKAVKQELSDEVPSWQLAKLGVADDLVRLAGAKGPVWVVNLTARKEHGSVSKQDLNVGVYTQARDIAGRLFSEIVGVFDDSIEFDVRSSERNEVLGFLVGLDLAAYSYKSAVSDPTAKTRWKIHLKGVSASLHKEALALGRAQNIARHLVNLPPNELNPVTYAETVQNLFKGKKGFKVEVWDELKLAKENMNLMLAVGQASDSQPRLVKLQYRSSKLREETPHIVLVGKGITFDSGGLDIKPPSGMRLMKKDMGGSAALVGYMSWLAEQSFPIAVDVYLGLAENAISSNAFRPGDIYKGRNGKSVEIHNTDAEGRLVLADVLALANESATKKTAFIGSVATLTGAAKVGLGADIAAYYSTDDSLAQLTQDLSVEVGDPVWRMPLYQPYRSLLRSQVADVSHCAASPFGGSITAALYLSDYVSICPFMHFDIYAWNDRAKGALREQGGSGQAVQTIIALTSHLANKKK